MVKVEKYTLPDTLVLKEIGAELKLKHKNG